MIHIPGTKTEGSECYLPMSPALQNELKSYLASRTDDSPFLFPGRSAQTKGKKIYSRRRFFEKIKRVTAFRAYMEKNPTVTAMNAWKELKSQNYPGGVKLTTKELRDYFATQVSAQVTDPNTVKSDAAHEPQHYDSLHPHGYGAHESGCAESRPTLGGKSGGNSLRKKTQNDMMRKLLVRLVKAQNARENHGGRSRT